MKIVLIFKFKFINLRLKKYGKFKIHKFRIELFLTEKLKKNKKNYINK